MTRQAAEKIRLFVQMLIPSYVAVQTARPGVQEASRPGSAQEAAVGDVEDGAVQDRRRFES
jgi:hypothetical protein